MYEDNVDVIVDTPDVPEVHEPSESEVKASRLGWVPKEEYRGNPDNWRDADEFLRKGEEIQGYLKKDLDKVQQMLTARDKEINELRSTMEEFRKFHNETEARAYKRAIEDLKQLKAVAIEQGDGSKVVELDEQIADLKEAQKKPQVAPVSSADQVNQEYLEWLPNNQWFVTKPELGRAATEYAEFLKFKDPTLAGKRLLDAVTAEIKDKYPEAFENPARQNSQVGTSSDNRPNSGKAKKRTYADLPADAKAACDKFVKTIPNFTVADYLKDYDWE